VWGSVGLHARANDVIGVRLFPPPLPPPTPSHTFSHLIYPLPSSLWPAIDAIG